jgi:hypothetical protein
MVCLLRKWRRLKVQVRAIELKDCGDGEGPGVDMED